jgi:polar amino acid transport system substrate-binding protein
MVAAATLALLLIVAGCGSSSGSSGSSAAPSASSSASGVTIAGATITADPTINALLPSAIRDSGVLRVAGSLPYAPWEYWDPPDSKNIAGFDYDLSQAIGAKLGVKAPFINTPFDSIILSVLGGKNDMVMADMYDNPDREKQLTFVDYAWDGTSIIVLKGNPDGITGLDSLAGKVVTVLRGSTQEALLTNLNKQFKADGKPQMTVLSLQGSPEGLLAIKGGKAVAQLTDHSQAAYTVNSTEPGKDFQIVTDPSSPHGYEPAIVGIGIAKGNTQLVTAVQKALQALIDEGSYKQIVDKYGLIGVDAALIDQGGVPLSSPSP